ncbi:MAG: hypothetical protein K8I00_00530, partial [Candidatus Omnitrophica bacterium]|nr:hypothetical protein [Candidatus Omnitrophota bacterium]
MKNKAKLQHKIYLSLGSFVFFLVILELLLRLGGFLYLENLLKSSQPSGNATNSDRTVILTIGDSYTVGGEGLWEDSYPSQLQDMLSQQYPGKYTVINGGICESNSSQTYEYFQKLVKKYDVDKVVLLVGSTNKFNLVGFKENPLHNAASHFRLVKLFKIFKLNLASKIQSMRPAAQPEGYHSQAINQQGNFDDEPSHYCPELMSQHHGKPLRLNESNYTEYA